jgi:hypothetical protein
MRPWVLRREIQLWLALPGIRHYPRHALPSPLYISLTSHPPRYKYLRQCLLSLFVQDVRPDGLLLWLEAADLAALPPGVRALQRLGLRIMPCENGLRSYKKLIPALELYPDAYIATADDDQIYPRDWLSSLAAASGSVVIAYHRAHRMRFEADGMPATYASWEREIGDQRPDDIVVPTGVAGILYPPGAFDPRVTDRELFQTLAPTCDDLWLRWMAELNGSRYRRAQSAGLRADLPTSTVAHLWAINSMGPMGNDLAVKALTTRFGPLRA